MYSDVVKGWTPFSGSKISVGRDVLTGILERLSNSLLGKVEWMGAVPSILSLFDFYGLKNVKLANLGGFKILLTFDNAEEALRDTF